MATHKNQERRAEKRNPGPELIRGLTGFRDALRDGVSLPDRFTVRMVELVLEPREYEPEEILAVRESLRASQAVFAKLLGVSIKTVQAWEQGGNPPSPTARRLLEVIESDPQPWEQIILNSAAVS